MNINYSLLNRAIDLYTSYGYTFVEVPWMVTPEASRATNPPEGGIFVLGDGRHLVGSAEQGFIQIAHTLKPNRRYASVSPCFRKGDTRDEFHQETFMKLELFSYCNGEMNDGLVKAHMQYARYVAIMLGIDPTALAPYYESSTNTDLNVLIHDNDTGMEFLEIGSYGYRTFGDTHIAYGTGLALPRFQYALERQIYAS